MNDLKFRDDPVVRPAVRPASGFALDRRNRKVMGVCAGIARHFDIDVMVVRAVFVLGTLLGFGSLALIYLAIGLIAD